MDSAHQKIVSADDFRFRMPKAEDGAAISKLIAACPPLDRNSAYCNLLQCSHFADTCIVAERDGYIAGWISGYRPPSEPEIGRASGRERGCQDVVISGGGESLK